MEAIVKKLFSLILFLNVAFYIPAKAESINSKAVAGYTLLGVGLYNAFYALTALKSYQRNTKLLRKDILICHMGMPSRIDYYRNESNKALQRGLKSTFYALATSITGGVLLGYGLFEK